MKKWVGLAAVVIIVGFVALPAQATVNVKPGSNEAHIKDLSNHFDANGNPLGDVDPAKGQELRSVLRVDDLEMKGAAYWNQPSDATPFGTSGDELTGIMYNLVITHIEDDGDIFYGAGNRNPLPDSADKDGDIIAWAAAHGATSYGGVIELYQDPTVSPTGDLNDTLSSASPASWVQGTAGARDQYPEATDGTLWLSGVLLDLTAFGVPEAQAGDLYKLENKGNGNFSGTAYMDVYDGSAAGSIGQRDEPYPGGPLLGDVWISTDISVGSNVFENPNWQAGSSDPMRFFVVPEPTIMLLFGGSILGGLIRRRF